MPRNILRIKERRGILFLSEHPRSISGTLSLVKGGEMRRGWQIRDFQVTEES